MGQSNSSLPSSLPDLALHCLRVADHSPASGQVEPFFDYLVGIETPDHPFDTADGAAGGGGGLGQGLVGLSPAALGRVLEDNEGKRVGLRVYNAKSQRIRGESAEVKYIESVPLSIDFQLTLSRDPPRPG